MAILLLGEIVYTRLEKHPFVVVRSEGCSPAPQPQGAMLLSSRQRLMPRLGQEQPLYQRAYQRQLGALLSTDRGWVRAPRGDSSSSESDPQPGWHLGRPGWRRQQTCQPDHVR